jgi:NADPH-dependent 7-cyano-7-deazaguanine reductase QueF
MPDKNVVELKSLKCICKVIRMVGMVHESVVKTAY